MTRPPDDDQPVGQPLLRVVHGDATPEEIAALVAVLLAARSADTEAPSPPRSAQNAWSDRSRLLRRPLSPGPGAWHRSTLPG
ncbi:MAG: acyl-CoA carboxylase subunit epsilon [Streptosporangiaceae bacterium]